MTLYRMSIERNPNSWVAYTQSSAPFFCKSDNSKKRLAIAIKHWKSKPDAAKRSTTLSNCFLAKGDFRVAIGPYQTALRTEPGTSERTIIGACLAGLADRASSRRVAGSDSSDPNFAESHFNLGYVLAEVGHRDEAQNSYRAVRPSRSMRSREKNCANSASRVFDSRLRAATARLRYVFRCRSGLVFRSASLRVAIVPTGVEYAGPSR